MDPEPLIAGAPDEMDAICAVEPFQLLMWWLESRGQVVKVRTAARKVCVRPGAGGFRARKLAQTRRGFIR